jgi:histone acetyltransferase SAS3
MEEELQQSVRLSEDAEYETADTNGEDALTHAPLKTQTIVAIPAEGRIAGSNSMDMDEDDDEELSDRDASGEEIDDEMDQDAEGEEYDELVDQQIVVSNDRPLEMNDDEEDEDEDADGEEDGDDGVGAVKIKPGETDDEDEEDEDGEDGEASDDSDLLSNAEDDSDEEPAWEDAGEVEGDEDSENDGPSNICIFCKQDEENDPSEDFETFLSCSRCGDNGMSSKS